MIYRAVIVDDESYIADSTAVFLRSDCPWDMEIQVFYDPREALESIRSQKTDIVITDIRMPEVDGLEMLRQVSEFWPMCQVILLTAHAQFEYVYQAVGRPSADYVLKQDGYEALLAAVNRAIQGCGIRAQVRETGVGTVEVWFPGQQGVPAQFERIRRILLDLLPCHLAVTFCFRYLSWEEFEGRSLSWAAVEAAGTTWEGLELSSTREDGE